MRQIRCHSLDVSDARINRHLVASEFVPHITLRLAGPQRTSPFKPNCLTAIPSRQKNAPLCMPIDMRCLGQAKSLERRTFLAAAYPRPSNDSVQNGINEGLWTLRPITLKSQVALRYRRPQPTNCLPFHNSHEGRCRPQCSLPPSLRSRCKCDL